MKQRSAADMPGAPGVRGGVFVVVLAWLAGLLVVASTEVAHAAPSIETITFVTVYNPPGGGTPVRRATAGKSIGLTDIDVDYDGDYEFNAKVAFSFDATEVAVTGQLQVTRTDFGGVLGPSTLPPLPASVEAVAVLKDTKDGATVRQHVSVGYDTRASSAPGQFTLDLGSCSTPNCKSTPTPCVEPCKGTKTTLSMGVVAASSPLTLTGELSAFAAGGGRKNPTRGDIHFSRVPDPSSPLVLTIWGTETKTAADPAVPTLTQIAISGNKVETTANVRVCRLPGAVYQPKQDGDTACDAARYTDQHLDSRIVDATVDQLPRDVANGNARLAVTLDDNDRGKNGGLHTITYVSTHPVQSIDVVDHTTRWKDTAKLESEHMYRLTGVPTWATLRLFDESDVGGTSDPIKKLQTITYDAGGQLTAVDVAAVDRRDGTATKRQTLKLVTVPTHLKVVQGATEESEPPDVMDGFDRHTRETVGLVEASGPIGLVEYSAADGDTSATPPADIGNAYVYTTHPADGVSYTDVRLLGVKEGSLTIGRHIHRDATATDPTQVSSGLDLLSVAGEMTPTPFRALAEDGSRVIDVHVNDLPGKLSLTLEPEKGRIDYKGTAPIADITLRASDPKGLFDRANTLDVTLEDVPEHVAVEYPHGESKNIELRVDHGEIGKLEIKALGEDDHVPAVLGDEDDGLVISDVLLENDEGETERDEYALFGRVRGLRHVAFRKSTHDVDTAKQQETSRNEFVLDTTQARRFVLWSDTTSDVKKYTWKDGYDWSDEDSRCDTEVVDKRLEHVEATIETLRPNGRLLFDHRHAYGKRECFENADVPFWVYPKDETKTITYTADQAGEGFEYLTTNGSTNLLVNVSPLPAFATFCQADGHQCLPDIGNTYGTSEGSLQLKASDYVTVNMVDCKLKLEDRSCGTPGGFCDVFRCFNLEVTDLELMRADFWGDQDGDGYSGDLYINTADWDTGNNQPFRRGRIRTGSIDFKFGDGFYARGAHISWDNIWDDETGDWSPDGTGGIVHCPAGTHWEVRAPGGWYDTTDDWCNRGSEA